MTVYGDNKSSIDIAKSDKEAVKIKHIWVKYHQLQEFIQQKEVNIKQISSTENVADIFTKALTPILYHEFVNMLGLNG